MLRLLIVVAGVLFCLLDPGQSLGGEAILRLLWALVVCGVWLIASMGCGALITHRLSTSEEPPPWDVALVVGLGVVGVAAHIPAALGGLGLLTGVVCEDSQGKISPLPLDPSI